METVTKIQLMLERRYFVLHTQQNRIKASFGNIKQFLVARKLSLQCEFSRLHVVFNVGGNNCDMDY